jgi:type III pantothenate kinase
MLLTIDIGNTNVTMGAFDGAKLVASWRTATLTRRQSDEYAFQIQGLLPMKGVSPGGITDVALCSVVPPLSGVFEEVVRSVFGVRPLIVGAGTKTGVRIQYDSPRDVGADRIVDAAAAYHLYGGPAIVVDFGTATVFDAISQDGTYLGGSIFPGLNIAAESLFLQTSQLRRVDFQAPPTAIGKNTVHAIQSGLVFGYTGVVEALVHRFKQELQAPEATVIATGGLATLIAAQTLCIAIVDQELTLKGLQLIHRLNTGPAD